jgi:cytochrome c-type biogenesis protein CcmE
VRLRRFTLPIGGAALLLTGALAFGDLNGNLVYYLTPSEATQQREAMGDEQRFRLAGEVVDGSIQQTGQVVQFQIADADDRVAVEHSGVPPQLFRTGIEVVVEGRWHGDRFTSDLMLVKHDEEYAPPESAGESTS